MRYVVRMTIVTRATIFACLTTALVQAPLPERVEPPDDRPVPEAEVVRVPNVPHPATSGTRIYLPDALSLDFGGATFAAAPAAAPAAARITVAASSSAGPHAALDADVLLPPSRAPPTS
jgi:hypothetical protein